MRRVYTAGQLNQRVALKRREVGDNALREAVGSWVLAFGAWAMVEPVAGRELVAGGALQQPVDMRFVIRFRSVALENHIVEWRGKTYDVVSALPVDGGSEWLEILATSGVRDAR